MDKNITNLCGTASWYQELADHTFPTSFVKLDDEELRAPADGQTKGDVAEEVQQRLKIPMSSFPGNCFVFTDLVAPTDIRAESPVQLLQVIRAAPRHVRLPWPADAQVYVLQPLAVIDLTDGEGEPQ